MIDKIVNIEEECEETISFPIGKEKDIERIRLKLLKIFNKNNANFIPLHDSFLISIDFKILILNKIQIKDFCSLLKTEKLIKEFLIIPVYDYNNENDENSKAVKLLLEIKNK